MERCDEDHAHRSHIIRESARRAFGLTPRALLAVRAGNRPRQSIFAQNRRSNYDRAGRHVCRLRRIRPPYTAMDNGLFEKYAIKVDHKFISGSAMNCGAQRSGNQRWKPAKNEERGWNS
jgi:hypothetical protein